MPQVGNRRLWNSVTWWSKHLAISGVLTLASIYIAARLGFMPTFGYVFFFDATVETAKLFGAGRYQAVNRLYVANCGHSRRPYSVIWMADGNFLGYARPEDVHRLFTCSAETPLQTMVALMRSTQ